MPRWETKENSTSKLRERKRPLHSEVLVQAEASIPLLKNEALSRLVALQTGSVVLERILVNNNWTPFPTFFTSVDSKDRSSCLESTLPEVLILKGVRWHKSRAKCVLILKGLGGHKNECNLFGSGESREC